MKIFLDNFTKADAFNFGMIVILILLLYFFYFSIRKNKQNQIKNLFVTKSSVYKILKKIKIPFNKSLRYNFNEKILQGYLYDGLCKNFVTVKKELQLKRGGRVDFDIANGSVGIEVKLTKSLNNGNAAIRSLEAQLREYIRVKYKNRNLILVIYGTKTENKLFKNDKYNIDLLKEIGIKFLLVELK